MAKNVGQGLFLTIQIDPATKEFPWVAFHYLGSIRAEGEAPSDEWLRAAAGPGSALVYHILYETGGPAAVNTLPGGEEWLAVVNSYPSTERHLGVHVGHLTEMNDADHAAWDAGGAAIVDQLTISGTASEVRRRLDEFADQGVTEAVYQPAGPDIPGELERMIAAAQG